MYRSIHTKKSKHVCLFDTAAYTEARLWSTGNPTLFGFVCPALPCQVVAQTRKPGAQYELVRPAWTAARTESWRFCLIHSTRKHRLSSNLKVHVLAANLHPQLFVLLAFQIRISILGAAGRIFPLIVELLEF